MILKSEFDHRAKFSRWLKSKLKGILNNGFYPFVTPVSSPLDVCFVVGCGHSGTTLMASRLGRLPGAHLLGWETDIFNPEHGLYSSYLRIEDFLRLAPADTKCLIEKTPKHLHAYARIRKVVPRAKFVVMTRDPLDNCASLYRRFGDIDYAIQRYRIDNDAILKIIENKEMCIRVKYEDLVEKPLETLAGVSSFVGLVWDQCVLSGGSTAYDNFAQTGNMDLRRSQVSKPIVSRAGSWKSIFTESEKKKVQISLKRTIKGLGYDAAFDE